ncbi:MAG: hypothetical protein NC089_05235 [Bacteroides sp.]|nr:hypothetical protein [Bacteroides sp.]MCM1549586.1 hypothetical protein [Clostridium sp.]
MDTKTTGIVAYLTWVGLLVAYLAGDKEGAKFHINQALVVFLFMLAGTVIMIIPFVGWILGGLWDVFMLVCWVMGLIAAVKEEEKEVPLIGKIHIIK